MRGLAHAPQFRDANLERLLGNEFLLNVDQAALYLSVSASTLNHWRSDGKGPRFVKLCGSTRGAIRYRVADLRSYVEQNTFSSVAEAELSNAMSRVSVYWYEWQAAHPFVAKGSHFLVDSALADRDTYVAVLTDPYARVRWLRPSIALRYPWLRPKRRLELLELFLASREGEGEEATISLEYGRNLAAIPEQHWGGHPDLTLDVLRAVKAGISVIG
ncbi:MAG: hypothetical protein RLY71_770 [Pseudomonadota bacterium]